nr:4-o-dimethylallyl-l-tyrosine synthase [Quercus suber]
MALIYRETTARLSRAYRALRGLDRFMVRDKRDIKSKRAERKWPDLSETDAAIWACDRRKEHNDVSEPQRSFMGHFDCTTRVWLNMPPGLAETNHVGARAKSMIYLCPVHFKSFTWNFRRPCQYIEPYRTCPPDRCSGHDISHNFISSQTMTFRSSLIDMHMPPSSLQCYKRDSFCEIKLEDASPIRGNQAALCWLRELGTPFEVLLDAAGYTAAARWRHLQSFNTFAIPYFGDNLRRESSFMTDNGCPVELSWDWGQDGSSPSVRYSLEPLCEPSERNAGRSSREAAGLEFVTDLSKHFGVPLDAFHYFWRSLVLSPAEHAVHSAMTRSDDFSQFFAAFNLEDDRSVLKTYFVPTLRAQSQGCTRYEIIKSVLAQSPGWSAFMTSFATIDEFMRTSSLSRHLDAEILSIDVAAASPRWYKLYVRCHETTFASVRHVASLGGRLASPALKQSLAQLYGLWVALFEPVSMEEDCALQSLSHRTAGILYYFEMYAGKPASTPKIYLPVRHYASSDAHVDRVVGAFVTEQAKAAGGNAVEPVRRFRTALDRISPARSMETTRGLHTYIGCTLAFGTVKLISYINPSFSHIKSDIK